MSPILPKSQMTEEDIKLHYITPAITAKWSRNLITMETKITDGKINLKGNLVVREKPKKADYVLYLGADQPIAIVEAKDNNHTVSFGLQQAIRDMLHDKGIDLDAMKADQHMEDVDDFDFICHVAYDRKPLTRRERANNVKKRDFLSRYSGVAREVLEALLDRYMNTGIYEIEQTEVLKLDLFRKYGKPAKIAQAFGGKEGYLKAIRDLEKELYGAG